MRPRKHVEMADSVRFSWNPDEFDALVQLCQRDDAVQVTLRHLPRRDCSILEAGCGTGRVVKYLYDLGYHNVQGIELNEDIVRWVDNKYPELGIRAGDILHMPFGPESFDVVLSYGVVEHFPQGLAALLRSLRRVLKTGGIAVVTVPSLNMFRRVPCALDRFLGLVNPKKNALARRLFGKRPLPARKTTECPYYVHLESGRFFEYRLRPREFESCCRDAGFEILRSVPISHIDGLYHQFGPPLVRFDNWALTVSRAAAVLNTLFKLIPSLHNHMHACILTKKSA